MLRFWEKVDKTGDRGKYTWNGSPCWLWTASRSKPGYGKWSVSRKKWSFAHRKSWELTRGEIPQGILVLHHCDNPPCVNPDHLFLGDKRDNALDYVYKGLHPRTKILVEQRADIKRLFAAGMKIIDIARKYKVAYTTIWGLIHAERYSRPWERVDIQHRLGFVSENGVTQKRPPVPRPSV